MPYLTEIKALAERLEVIHPDEVQGCTEEEIQTLESALHIRLPGAYREFLAWCGKRAGGFFRGSAWRPIADNLISVQSSAQELLDENHFPQKLPPNMFVFFMYQGYNFLFFHLNEGDNPCLHFYMEGEAEFRKEEFCSFTDFLEYSILSRYVIAINNSIRENIKLLAEQYRRSYK